MNVEEEKQYTCFLCLNDPTKKNNLLNCSLDEECSMLQKLDIKYTLGCQCQNLAQF